MIQGGCLQLSHWGDVGMQSLVPHHLYNIFLMDSLTSGIVWQIGFGVDLVSLSWDPYGISLYLSLQVIDVMMSFTCIIVLDLQVTQLYGFNPPIGDAEPLLLRQDPSLKNPKQGPYNFYKDIKGWIGFNLIVFIPLPILSHLDNANPTVSHKSLSGLKGHYTQPKVDTHFLRQWGPPIPWFTIL